MRGNLQQRWTKASQTVRRKPTEHGTQKPNEECVRRQSPDSEMTIGFSIMEFSIAPDMSSFVAVVEGKVSTEWN